MSRFTLAADRSDANEAACRRASREWADGYHKDIGMILVEPRTHRLVNYVEQERSYAETVRFVLAILPAKPACQLDVMDPVGGFTCALALARIEADESEPMPSDIVVGRLWAKRLGLADVHFHQGVRKVLPRADGFFDLLVSAAMLECVADHVAVVRQIYRVLNPDGCRYVEVLSYFCPFEPHCEIAWLPMMPKPSTKGYVRMRDYYPGFFVHLNYTHWARPNRLLHEADLRISTIAEVSDWRPRRSARSRLRPAYGLRTFRAPASNPGLAYDRAGSRFAVG